jgi:DNA-directed RNA polymerase specialized sigma24 family protein
VDFAQIYGAYYKAVYLYALRLSGNEHLAAEITGETFSKPF